MYQYSFANVDLLITAAYAGKPAGNPSNFKVEGFGTGQGLINIARRAPIATTTFGAYGRMVVNMQRIRAGDLSFPVLMNAEENKYLQDWANYFQEQADANGELITPIQAKLVDNMGKDKVTLTNGVILAMPAISRGQEINTVTWVLTFEEVVIERNIGEDKTNLGN